MTPLTLLVAEMNGRFSVTLDSHASLEEAEADYAQANPEEVVHNRISFDLGCDSRLPYDAIRAICDASDQEGGIRDALEHMLTEVLDAGRQIERKRINARLVRIVEAALTEEASSP